MCRCRSKENDDTSISEPTIQPQTIEVGMGKSHQRDAEEIMGQRMTRKHENDKSTTTYHQKKRSKDRTKAL